jgi:hypothetical protein
MVMTATFEDVSQKVNARWKSVNYWGEYQGGQHYWGFKGGFVHLNNLTGTVKIHRRDKPTVDL